MNLHKALKLLLEEGHPTAQSEPVYRLAWAAVTDALAALPVLPGDGDELVIGPAKEAQTLELLDDLTQVLRGIVYDMAREEVLHQVQNISKAADKARELAQQASKSYQATRTTWDGLHSRLQLVEEEAGVHARDPQQRPLHKDVDKLMGEIFGMPAHHGGVANLPHRVDRLATRLARVEEQAGVEGSDSWQASLQHRLARLSEDVSANNDALVGQGARDLGLVGQTEELAGKLDELVERVKELDAHGVKARGTLCDRMKELEQKLKALGQHPNLT